MERNGEVLARIGPTAARLSVSSSSRPITLTCSRVGSQTTTTYVDAVVDPGTTAGYLLGAGIAGLVAGAASGHTHTYPASVTVTLVPDRFPSAPARDAFFEQQRAAIRETADAELARLKSGCPPNDAVYCRSIQEPIEQRRDAQLAQLTAQQAAAQVGG